MRGKSTQQSHGTTIYYVDLTALSRRVEYLGLIATRGFCAVEGLIRPLDDGFQGNCLTFLTGCARARHTDGDRARHASAIWLLILTGRTPSIWSSDPPTCVSAAGSLSR